MKRILINGTYAEDLRVAIIDGHKLLDLDIESVARTVNKGNIYKGVITKVEASLEACFINYGTDKHGFLPIKDVHKGYFSPQESSVPISEVKINSVLQEGQELIVQVERDERADKGAALSTFITLVGKYLVLLPNNTKGGGISRRLVGAERNEVKALFSSLNLDSRHSLIARNQSLGVEPAELQADLDFLVRLWDTIENAAASDNGPFLIYRERNLIVQALRDHLSEDIGEVIVDDEEIYERADRFLSQVMPASRSKLKLHNKASPLFSRFRIENQIKLAFGRKVNLPSGGSLIIDQTEALLSIDVNSGKATKGEGMDETALQTNMEAAEEVARQLKVRDIGGLIVIDLIDMTISRDQRKVEDALKESLKVDRARSQVGRISQFGLLEMSRQRLRTSISDMSYRPCPRCSGMGAVRSVVSSSLDLLRRIEEESLKNGTAGIRVTIPLDMATYLFNEKRAELHELESRVSAKIIIIPSSRLTEPQLDRLKSTELDDLVGIATYHQKVSYSNIEPPITDSLKRSKPETPRIQYDQIYSLKATSSSASKSISARIMRSVCSLFRNSEKSDSSSRTKKVQQKAGRQQPQNKPGGNPMKGNKSQGDREHNQRSSPYSGTRNKRPANSGKKQTAKASQEGKQPNTKRIPQAQKPRPQSENQGSNRNAPKREAPARHRQNQQQKTYPGVIVSVDHIPSDLPDDIGNH